MCARQLPAEYPPQQPADQSPPTIERGDDPLADTPIHVPAHNLARAQLYPRLYVAHPTRESVRCRTCAPIRPQVRRPAPTHLRPPPPTPPSNGHADVRSHIHSFHTSCPPNGTPKAAPQKQLLNVRISKSLRLRHNHVTSCLPPPFNVYPCLPTSTRSAPVPQPAPQPRPVYSRSRSVALPVSRRSRAYSSLASCRRLPVYSIRAYPHSTAGQSQLSIVFTYVFSQ